MAVLDRARSDLRLARETHRPCRDTSAQPAVRSLIMLLRITFWLVMTAALLKATSAFSLAARVRSTAPSPSASVAAKLRPPAFVPSRPTTIMDKRRHAPAVATMALTSVSSSLLSVDGSCGLAAWLLIALYNKVVSRISSEWSAQNADNRAVWTRYILEKGDYILGVQTLRNSLTAASFFASACFTVLSLLVGISLRNPLTPLATVKYSVMAFLLVGAALSYLQSVRYMNTCAFLFQVANDQRDETGSRGTVMLLMVLSQNCWSAGERLLYYMVPAGMWLVGGGPAMFVLTCLLLPVLYYLDLPAPTNLLKEGEPSLEPYQYLLEGRLKWLDFFGFSTALNVAQRTVAKSGDYAKDKYGLESATWPPRPVETNDDDFTRDLSGL